MDIKNVSDILSLSEQIGIHDLSKLQEMGFRSILRSKEWMAEPKSQAVTPE